MGAPPRSALWPLAALCALVLAAAEGQVQPAAAPRRHFLERAAEHAAQAPSQAEGAPGLRGGRSLAPVKGGQAEAAGGEEEVHTQVEVPQGEEVPTTQAASNASHAPEDTTVSIETGVNKPPLHMVQVLRRHNFYRCMHGAPPLSWDSTIEANAKQWVLRGGGMKSPPSMLERVGDFSPLGENEWRDDAAGVQSDDPVATWYAQINMTDGGLVGNYSQSWAQYTQVVWRSSRRVGCGLLNKALVCQYFPAGNVDGLYSVEVRAPVKNETDCSKEL